MLNKKEINKRIKEFKEKGLVFPMTNDLVFKSVIQDENLKDYTAFLINNITNRNIKPEDIVFINTEETKENITDKLNYHDTLLDVDKNKISLEMNASDDLTIRNRNKYHFHTGVYKVINLSYNLGEEKYFEQLNFNNVDTIGKLISKYKMIDVDTGSEDKEERNYSKYKINIAKINNKYYNETKKLTRFEKALLIMTLPSKEELRKVSRGDEMLMKVVKKLENLSEDPNSPHYWDSYFDTEKAIEFGRKLEMKKAIEEKTKEVTEKVTNEVTEKVSKEKAIDIAKAMLKDNADINNIVKYTGLTKNEVEDLK